MLIHLENKILAMPLPGAFSTNEINKQIKMGMIPRLNQYVPNMNVYVMSTFVQLVRNMVAIIIQERIGINYSFLEVHMFMSNFRDQLRYFSPSADIKRCSHLDRLGRLYDVKLPTPENQVMEINIDSRVDETHAQGWKTQRSATSPQASSSPYTLHKSAWTTF